MPLHQDRFRRVVEREGLDALVATTAEHVYYATDYYGLGQWIMPRSSQAFAVLPAAPDARPWVVCSVGESDTAYELGFGGLQVEDTVVIEEDGARMLTTLDRELLVVDA